jgi:outer membrane protein OmpA-like peptidoglycan-associated protein
MMRFLYLPLILFSYTIFAQEEIVYSVYFDFDKFQIKDDNKIEMLNFIKEYDSTRIESIQIYGYCDDIGNDAYNLKLSNERAAQVKNTLIENGVKQKIIVTIEGKGRVLIEDDLETNLPAARQKNRRVDVWLVFKKSVINDLNLPQVYTSFNDKMKVGDRIFLEKLYFEQGSSRLTEKARGELNKIVRQLYKFKKYHIEIQGHVCCTPKRQKEAIDIDTKKRELSKNRAKAVYNFLIMRDIKKHRMTHVGKGNVEPLGKEPQLDRRVELVITKVE